MHSDTQIKEIYKREFYETHVKHEETEIETITKRFAHDRMFKVPN